MGSTPAAREIRIEPLLQPLENQEKRNHLISGMAIGAGVSLLSGRMPKLVEALRPGLKAAVKAAYSAVEAVAVVAEEIQDLVFEARAE